MKTDELNTLGVIVGIAGFGYAIYTQCKMNKICDKIDKSLDDIADSAEIDIPKSVVDNAVNKAVDREVDYAIRCATDKVIKEIKADMHSQIKKEVDSVYSEIRTDVSSKVSKEVSNIDMKKLSRDITAKAEQKIIDKFDGDLDDILEKYNRELNSISKIYSSIADTLSNTNKEKETVLRIG